MMGMSQYQCLQQLCTVCDQPITGDEAERNRANRALFGAADTYKVCCKCKQPVGDSTERDEKYRQRWRNHKDEKMRSVVRGIDIEQLPPDKLFMGVVIAEGENDDGRQITVTSTGAGLHVQVGGMENRVQISLKQIVAQAIAASDEMQAAHSLIGELEAKGITESDMDELVHEIGSKEDSAVNNQGLPAQVLHILRQCGVEEGSRLIRATWEEA